MMRVMPNTQSAPAEIVPAIGAVTVHCPSPGKGEHDEDPTIRSVNSPEIGGLQGGHHSVTGQCDSPKHADPGGAMFPQPEPDQIAAADLQEAGDEEKGD